MPSERCSYCGSTSNDHVCWSCFSDTVADLEDKIRDLQNRLSALEAKGK